MLVKRFSLKWSESSAHVTPHSASRVSAHSVFQLFTLPNLVMLDLRGLLHTLVNPTSNEQYSRDQQTLTDLFQKPGKYLSC